MPGGEPYGVLLGDYEFTNHVDDVTLLSQLSEWPPPRSPRFWLPPAPALFGLDTFRTWSSRSTWTYVPTVGVPEVAHLARQEDSAVPWLDAAANVDARAL